MFRGTGAIERTMWHPLPCDVVPVLSLLFAAAATVPGLRWHAPEGCPTHDEAATYLEGRLRVTPETGSFEVWVKRTHDGWQATVAVDQASPRQLSAASCDDVMAAAMVVIAVTRDAEPERLVPEPEQEATPQPPATPQHPATPQPPATPPTPATPQPGPESGPGPRLDPDHTPGPTTSVPALTASPDRLTHWLGIHAGVAAIHTPALTARVGGRYEFGRSSWALRLAGHYDSPRELRYPDAQVGGRFQSVGGTLSGCWVPGRGVWSGAVCGGGSGGAIFGFGTGVSDPSRGRAMRFGVHGSAGVRWTWNEVWRLAIDGLFSAGIVRPEFRVGNRAPVFRSPRFGAAGMIGVERRIR